MHEFSVLAGRWEPPVDDVRRIHLCNGYKGNFSTGIWNSTALFCRDPVKAVQRLLFVCELAEKVDILFIFEAHGQEGSQINLVDRLSKSHRVEYFPGTSNAIGGVAVCTKRSFMVICGKPEFKVLDSGRAICVTFTSGSQRFGAIGVHVDPHYTFVQKRALIRQVSQQVKGRQDLTWVVCGDFNCEAIGERGFNADRGAFMESMSSENLANTWNEYLGELIEHHQADFTRAQNGPFGVTLSRIDRIYSNLPPWRLLTTEVRTMTVGRVTDDGRLSDHVPILSFVCDADVLGQRPLPLWTTKDPLYEVALRQEIEHRKLEELSPADAVLQMKACMRIASKRVVEKSSRRGAKTIEEKIYWALLCARSLYHGHGRSAIRALFAYPALEEFVVMTSSSSTKFNCKMDGLNAHISSLMNESLEKLQSDIEEVKDLPEYEKLQKRSAIKRLMDQWATKNRKASLQGARDEAGHVVNNPDKAAEVFISHWRKVAEEKHIDKQLAREFLSRHMRKIPQFRTVLTFVEFLELVRGLPDSACGPDGIPYSAWRRAPEKAVGVLFRLYCSLFTNDAVAEDFNYAWLVLLAKGDHDDDDTVVARGPDETRPVSLANSDSKICEAALNKPLAHEMKTWASWDQRGFIHDRMMVDNVIEIDTYGRVASVSIDFGPNGQNSMGSKLPIMAFFDFAAAFPSVAWMYIWLCMKYCGLPRPFRRAFQKLYKNNVHFLRFMGKVFRAYTNESGVKTGGTASGTIFVICIEPFLQMLRSRCGPRDFGRGFADDIGYVIFDLKVTLPVFKECFDVFGIVSNVKLKIKKTVLVPLWRCSLYEARKIISLVVPAWSEAKVAFHAKYLGIELGPCSADLIWSAALDRYVAKVQAARATGAGLLSSVLEYNIMCITSLSYVGQFSASSREVLATEAKMLQRLTGCPRYTFSKEALWCLDSLGMTKSFSSVQISNTAAMVRMALRTTTVFSKMKALLDTAVTSDDAMMQSLVSGEVGNFDTPAIVNTLQKAIDSAFLPDITHSAWKLHLQSMQGSMNNGSFQKAITKYLNIASLQFNAADFMSRRLSRWQSAVSDDGRAWWSFSGPFVIQLCRYELAGAPQCVVAAYLKTLLNGWASARRLHSHPVKCMFGCGSRQDSIEHYLECGNVQAIWQRFARNDWGAFECRLAVGCTDIRERITRVFFLYGIYAAYNARRHGRTCHSAVDECTEIVKSKVTYALGRSSQRVRHLFGDVAPIMNARTSAECASVGNVLFSFRKRARNTQSINAKRQKRDPKRIKTDVSKVYRF